MPKALVLEREREMTGPWYGNGDAAAVLTRPKVRRRPHHEVRRRTHGPAKRLPFEMLALELEQAASVTSSTRRLVQHPAYRGILALGPDAIPLLLERLKTEENRPVWLRLLGSLTTFQPGAGTETIREAADAWIRWAKYGGFRAGPEA